MAITPQEIAETRGMVAEQNLDIRTITMGISLMGCADENLDRMCTKVYDRVTSTAENLVQTAEDLERAVVARKHMHLAVDKKKPFAHVFRDRRKLALAQLKLVHLLADGAVLLAELVKKRGELGVAWQRGGVVQMNGVDGLCDALRESVRQHAAEDENDRRDP